MTHLPIISQGTKIIMLLILLAAPILPPQNEYKEVASVDAVKEIYQDLFVDQDCVEDTDIEKAIAEIIPDTEDEEEWLDQFSEIKGQLYDYAKGKGWSRYDEGWNLKEALEQAHLKICMALSDAGINYEISKSWSAGHFASIYLEDGRRIANHSNGERSDGVYSSYDLAFKTKEIIKEVIK